jgi:DNA-binding CsgD family transcriptional regulator
LCGVLSERESTVAAFVAAGLGNTAIAERLSISKKTVEKHVGSIYDKLGVRTRAQLAGLIASDDPRTQSGKGELTSPQHRCPREGASRHFEPISSRTRTMRRRLTKRLKKRTVPKYYDTSN